MNSSKLLFLVCVVVLGSARAQFGFGSGGSSAGDLASTCPAEFTRLSPCVESSGALQECVACVTGFVLEQEGILTQAPTEGENATDVTATTARNNGANETEAPYACDDLQDDICTSIQTCGDACALVNRDTVLTFGADCEDLFLKLVGCVLGDLGSAIVGNCPVEGSCADIAGGEVEGERTDVEEENGENVDEDEDAALRWKPLACIFIMGFGVATRIMI
jgi:hypothetical protein